MRAKKGIIVAAGRATRLHPATLVFGKQFLPVYDKPMIFYPLSTLIQAGIRDVLIIVAPRDLELFRQLLGDGSSIGMKIAYKTQEVAGGIADAFLLGEDFIGGDDVCLILGDNLFHGDSLSAALASGQQEDKAGAVIFCHHVSNPTAYGVAALDDAGQVTALVEKPETFVSNWAVTGLYFYDGRAVEFAHTLKPSKRGELEITDLNALYLREGALKAYTLGQDIFWQDLGTHDGLLDAAVFVRNAGARIGCPYEAAFRQGFIDAPQLQKIAEKLGNKAYTESLLALV